MLRISSLTAVERKELNEIIKDILRENGIITKQEGNTYKVPLNPAQWFLQKYDKDAREWAVRKKNT